MEHQLEKMPPAPTSQPLSVDWSQLQLRQADLLVQGHPKTLAADSGLCLDTIYRAKQGRPLSFLATLRISHTQQDFAYVALALRKCGYLLTCINRLPATLTTHTLAALLMDRMGILLHCCGKLTEQQPLTDHDLQQAEEAVRAIKSAADALLERLHEQQREQQS